MEPVSDAGEGHLGSETPMSQVIRTIAMLLVWVLRFLARGISRIFSWVWEFIHAWRLRRILGWVCLSVLMLGAGRFVPVLWGRFALVYEASHQARRSKDRSDNEIREVLRRTAFSYGFTDVIEQDEAFQMENTTDEDGTLLCTVIIDLRQRVGFYGLFHVPVHIRTRVTRPVDPEVIKPKSLEDRVLNG